MSTDTWTSQRARVAALSRSRNANDPELVTAKLNLKAARLESHISRIIAEAPPLNIEQRARIAALLTVGGLNE